MISIYTRPVSSRFVLIRDHSLMDLIIVALLRLLNLEFSVLLLQGILRLLKAKYLPIFSLLYLILA